MKFLKGLIINLQFFTALPLKMELPMDNEHLGNAVKTFPLLGLLQGALYSGLLFILSQWSPLSPLALAFILWLSMIIVTGGLHIDGWMDASDAFFSYQDKERRLMIMQDSRIGAFGVQSVIVMLAARFLFIYEIVTSLSPITYILILFIPFLSKSVMGVVLLTVQAAKKEGLAALFQGAGKRLSLAIYPFYLILALAVVVAINTAWIWPILILIAVAVLGYFFIRSKAVKWFGGITGDVIGASVEGTELVLWMTLWLLHYFVMA